MIEIPLISIAMTTYNGEKYLEEQLDSIYAQTYKNIEVIVTDDCSTDNTKIILQEYSKLYGLKYYINETNLGFVKNFEKAISLCKGEYIALSDQDDIWEEEKLEVLVKLIGENLLIHSDCSLVDQKGSFLQTKWKKESGHNISMSNLLFRNVVTGCTVLFRKSLIKIALPFPEGLSYHDWWFAICAAENEKITYTSKCLIRYRQHEDQDTGVPVNKKINILNLVYLNVISRWNGKDIPRIIGYKKHRKNLLAIRKVEYIKKHLVVVDDVLRYFEDYLEHKIHFRTFFIGLKYNKSLYPTKNYLYLKNILFDIIG